MTERIFDGDHCPDDASAPDPARRLRPAAALAFALLAAWAWLAERLLAERERWPLWIPVGMGLGVAGYFALTVEPPGWAGPVAVALPAGLAWLVRRRSGVLGTGALVAVLAVASVAVGFAAAQGRTALVAAPVLQRDHGPVAVRGRVVGVEALTNGTRLVLAELTIARLPAARTPDRVRVRLRPGQPVPPAGAVVTVRALLHPPPAPAEPGAYDFQRRAFFDRIGGVGSAYGAPVVEEAPATTGWRGAGVWLEGVRQVIRARVEAALPQPVAAVTVALLNGQQNGVADAVMQDMRNSGLAHLLSISGLHITVVAMLVFGVTRALLALVESVALRWPIKKIAAVLGVLAAVAYTLLVGAPVPTLRSVLMTGVVLLAMVVDRSALSVRLIAFAAVVALLIEPEELVGPSFQMSFGAVLALIAAYEVVNPVFRRWNRAVGGVGRVALHLIGLAFTSVVATIATTPFSLFHFQQLAFYGVLANMVAVPLTTLWVMPWTLVVYLLMPLGWEWIAMAPLGWGVGGVVWTAHAVGALPGATMTLPAMPPWGLGGMVLGGLWLCLWRGGWRWLGVAPVVAGLLSPMVTQRPDVLVAGDGRLIAVRAADGGLSLSSPTVNRMTAGMWLHRDGRTAPSPPWPRGGRGADGRLSCDALGCLYRAGGRTVAVVRAADALAEDCAGADVVISLVEGARGCRGARVIDGWRLRRDGAHTVVFTAGGVRIDSVGAWRGRRPWTVP